ncbi:PadR family transcriptional regulator [Pseudooceanicola sp. 502str34]|uniref:PadR family transcriptional regulator n=1 Tax=Maritimibacter alkaliphilus TaxID=404236 RepID=UPI001C96CBA4|nr:PadR family transcriptional regulator [Maritimibacter alkaliphilus]MBY6090005.1 PadR family transcriptional regulator [Maritimibacter alkaliphilus]
MDYGEIRLLLLSLLTEGPRHGYELIRAVEELFGGSYTPSPGVIYPTLAWAEDMGFAVAMTEGTRKTYELTEAGRAHLEEQQPALEGLRSRIGGMAGSGRAGVPPVVMSAMDSLKAALRQQFRGRSWTEADAAEIAAVIESAAAQIAASSKTDPQDT